MDNKAAKFFLQIKTFIFENLLLVVILFCVTVSILSRSYFDLSYISPDSAHYLRAAREILRGNGFNVYPEWFGIWPIGYPFLIAVVAFITRAEIYLASKILSVIIVWLIGIMLYKRFGKTAWLYAFVMLNVGFRYIFFYTWSETTFILGMFLFAFWTADIICEDTVRISHYIKLTLAALLLFLSRYIGAFALIIVGLLWLGNMYSALKFRDKTAWKRVIYLSLSGVAAGAFIITYLLINQKMTGYMTGLARVPAGQVRDLLLELYRAQMIEMDYVFDTFFSIGSARLALLLWFIFIGFLIFSVTKNKKNIIKRDKDVIIPIIFIIIGTVYWVAIVIMRLASDFDDFGFRLLFPSSFMLFIGFAGLLVQNEKVKAFIIRYCGKFIPALCLMGFLLMILVITPRLNGTSGYRQVKANVLATYAEIPDGSIVLGGDTVHLLFMRDNLDAMNIDLEDNDLQSFLENISGYEEIYIYVPEMKRQLAESSNSTGGLYTFFEQYRDSEEMFVRVK
ncbi:MAG: hypothetical protein FWE14_00525 [Lachnospiraceae bacterium]|nr:hypothetical protein [Lachnospiraceae bacterium]